MQEKINEFYKNKSGEEKLLIALSMFETARELVISSLPNNLSERELQEALFLLFYGNDFSVNEKEKSLQIFSHNFTRIKLLEISVIHVYFTIFSNLAISSLSEAAFSNSRSFAASCI